MQYVHIFVFRPFLFISCAVRIAVVLLVIAGLGLPVKGQVSLTAIGTAYQQSFDALAGSFTNNVSLTGWYLEPAALYNGIDGGGGSVTGFYGYGSAGEFAIGNLGGGAAGVVFQNATGQTITCLQIRYRGEQWRRGESGGDLGNVAVSYRQSSAPITDINTGFSSGGGWSGLDFTAVAPDPTCGSNGTAQNGNTNFQLKTAAIAVNIPSGEYFAVRWSFSTPVGCAPHGLAIDSLTLIPQTAPDAPGSMPPSNVICTGFRANWLPVAGAASYRLDVATDPGFSSFVSGYNNFDAGNATFATLSGLSPGTNYYYRVRGVNACGETGVSNLLQSVVTPAAPATPVLQPFTNISCTGFTVNWTAVSGAGSYELDVATNPGFTVFVSGYNGFPTTGTSEAVSGLLVNNTYYVRVRAVGSCGIGNNSPSQSVITLGTPAVPTIQPATAINCNQFNANWSLVSGATEYHLDVATDAGFSIIVPGYNNLNVGNVSTQAVTGLAAGVSYYYRVRAVNSCGTSGNSGSQNVSTLSSPPAPTYPSSPVTGQNCTGFTVNWNAVSGASSYRLDVATDTGFVSLVAGYANKTVTGTSDVVAGLIPGNTYYFRVRAVNSCGTGSNGIRQIAVTNALPAKTIFTGVLGVACGPPHSFQVTWNPVSGASGYELEVATAGSFAPAALLPGYPVIAPGSATNFTVTGLATPTVYYVRLRVQNACGNGPYSDTLTINNFQSVGIPVSQPASFQDCNEFNANWVSVSGATGYDVEVASDAGFTTPVPGSPFNVTGGSTITRKITGLVTGTYYYRVRAKNTCNTSLYSGTQTAVLQPLAPPVLPASNILCDRFTANWQTVTSAASYQLDVSTDPSFSLPSLVPGYNPLTPLISVNNVVVIPGSYPAGTTFYYRLRAFTSCGASVNSGTIAVQLASKPATVVTQNATGVGCNSFVARWNFVANAGSYYIEVDNEPTFTPPLVTSISGISATQDSILISGLTAGTQYYYRVLAGSSCGPGPFSTAQTVITNSLPGIVNSRIPVAITCSSFVARWETVSGATGYQLEVSTKPDFSVLVTGYNPKPVSGLSDTVQGAGITPATTYYYRVRAVNACGNGTGFSAIQSCTTAVPAPGVPGILPASAIGCTNFTANWNPVLGTVTGYRFDLSTTATFTAGTFISGYEDLALPAALPYSINISGLTPGISYYYRVRAVNDCGSSISSAGQKVDLLPLPGAPASASVSNKACTSFVANWATVSGATGYELDVATSNTFTGGTLLPAYTALAVSSNSQLVSGLSPGVTYYFRVRAVNSCGAGANSTPVLVTTSNLPSVPLLIPPTPADVNCLDFTARWNPSDSAIDYRLDVAKDAAFNTILPLYNDLPVDALFMIVTGLDAGTAYYYRVRARSICGSTGNSTTGQVLTRPLPAAPVALPDSATNCTSFFARWDLVPGANRGYHFDLSTAADFRPDSLVAGFSDRALTDTLQNRLFVSGLRPNTTYYYRVRAHNDCGGGNNSNVIEMRTAGAPVIPVAVPASAITCSTFTANWNPVPGALSYYLDIAFDADFTDYLPGYQNLFMSTNSRLVGPLLEIGRRYYYRVRAVSECGIIGANSNTISVQTTPIPPIPTNLRAEALYCDGFRAAWDGVAGATNYAIDVSTDSLFIVVLPAFNRLLVSGVQFEVRGLLEGQRYYFRIRSANACGTSDASGFVAVTTVSKPPTPTALNSTEAFCGGFRSNWQRVISAESYVLEIADDSTFLTSVRRYPYVVKTDTFITGLLPAKTYYYRVSAENACGISPVSNVIAAATLPLAPAPVPRIVASYCDGFQLAWDSTAGALAYQLQLGTDSAALLDLVPNSTQLRRFDGRDTIVGTSVRLSGLDTNRTYYLAMRAISACTPPYVHPDTSVIIRAATDPLPPVPIVDSARFVGCSMFLAGWDKRDSSITQFIFEAAIDSNFFNPLPGYTNLSISLPYQEVRNLVPGETYWYRVKNVTSCASAFSAPVKVRLRPQPIVSFELPSPYDSVCFDRPDALLVGGFPQGGTYGGDRVVQNQFVATFNAQGLPSGLYPISYQINDSYSGCLSNVAVDSIFVRPQPVAKVDSIDGDLRVCEGISRCTLQIVSNDPLIRWSNQLSSNRIVVETPGRYWAQLLGPGNCIYNSDTVEVRPRFPIVPTAPVLLGPISRADTFLRGTGGGNPVTGAGTLIYVYVNNELRDTTRLRADNTWALQLRNRYLQPGDKVVARAATDLNCDDRVTVVDFPGPPSNEVIVDEIPLNTAFSPNGDGINDRWVILKNIDVIFPFHRIQIFSRWGQLVLDRAPYRNDWDGGGQPDGTYFFVLELGDSDNTVYKGTVTLMR